MKRLIIIAALITIVAVVITGSIAYTIGLEQGGPATAIAAGEHHHHWHPWGFGFFLGPFLFILFWAIIIRGMFFGRACRGRHGRYRCGSFEDWHREAHERMWNDPRGEGASTK